MEMKRAVGVHTKAKKETLNAATVLHVPPSDVLLFDYEDGTRHALSL